MDPRKHNFGCKFVNVVVVWTQRVTSFHVEPEKTSANDIYQVAFRVLADFCYCSKSYWKSKLQLGWNCNQRQKQTLL